MKFEGWYLLLGGLLLGVTFLDRAVKRLPITTTLVYLSIGIVLGPFGLHIAHLDPVENSDLLERVTELAVIVSLFTAGLKLRAGFSDKRWHVPISLAFISMALTVGLIAAFGIYAIGLSVGAAVLLGAVLAPTDPVLASEVQLAHPGDRDRLRFSLTGEAGLNDGTAFPFVMLGLGLLGLHKLGVNGWRWVFIDLLWAVVAGLAIGGCLGIAVGKTIVHLRRKHEETVGRDEFITLGLIGAAYGAAIYLKAYGFLAVFAAGLALRHIEMEEAGDAPAVVEEQNESDNTNPPEENSRPSQMARNVLRANEELERILEVGVVLLLGVMLSSLYLSWSALGLALALFLLIRPFSILVGTLTSDLTFIRRAFIAWFGIRGIGSLYYLMYAINHGLEEGLATRLTGLVLSVVAFSIFIHGFSVTPLMNLYEIRKGSPRGP